MQELQTFYTEERDKMLVDVHRDKPQRPAADTAAHGASKSVESS